MNSALSAAAGVVTFLVLMVAWTPGAAQDGPSLVLRADGDAWVLEPTGDTVQLSDLAAAVGDELGLRLRWPLRTGGGFTGERAANEVLTAVTRPRRIPRDGLRKAVEELLATVDHELREASWGGGGFLDMVPVNRTRPLNPGYDWTLALPVDERTLEEVRSQDSLVMLTVALEHADVGSVNEMLTAGRPWGDRFRAEQENDRLVVVARAGDARRVVELLRKLDVPGAPRSDGSRSTLDRLDELRAGIEALEARATALAAR